MFTGGVFLVAFLTFHLSSQQDCQRGIVIHTWSIELDEIFLSDVVHSRVYETGSTTSPEIYRGIKPNTTGCTVTADRMYLECGPGEGVLSDGDIGPTDSVDVSDPDQVTRFFVWHRDNGSVGLQYTATDVFSVSYVDVYTLSLTSAKIGPPETTSFITDLSPTIIEATITPQNCSFSSTTNTLTRNTFTLPQNPDNVVIIFNFNVDTDWMFISEIQLCAGDPPSSISCDSPTTTDPTTQTPTSSPPPSPTPPSLTLSPLPPSVTPDLGQPESVSLTCSVASPPTDDYQYQWQWWRNGTLLSNTDNRFSITQSTNTQSSSLKISDLRYSDAGDYMCRVEYGPCSGGLDCSETTPVTGNIFLDLPGKTVKFRQGKASIPVFLTGKKELTWQT